MLMWLSEQLLVIDPGFAVFQYLTLRAFSQPALRWRSPWWSAPT